jgi:hypothetical protein
MGAWPRVLSFLDETARKTEIVLQGFRAAMCKVALALPKAHDFSSQAPCRKLVVLTISVAAGQDTHWVPRLIVFTAYAARGN